MRLVHVVAALSLFAAASAAAQVGTYRPGTPYTALPANAADACERTCSGDAGCRGWNFVEMRSGGVCELNSQDVAPVPSANATSGAAPRLHPASSRIVRMPDSATVRIGTPQVTHKAARKIVEPVPRRVTPRPAGGLNAGRTSAAPRSIPARPTTVSTGRQGPRLSHALDSLPHAAPRPAPRPAQVVTRAVPAPQPRPVAAPVVAQPPATPQPALAGSPTSSAMPPRPVTQESLFGSLYDDVSVPAPAEPRALADPSAPVATSESRPVAGLQDN